MMSDASVSRPCVSQLLDLALAEVGAGVRPVELLRDLADDDRAGGVGEPLELLEVLVERLARAVPA